MSANVARYQPHMTEPGVEQSAIGMLVPFSDYEALLKERDAAQKYAALCRVQFEKGSMAADAFQKQVMVLEKERDKLKAKLDAAREEVLSLREKIRKTIGGQTGSL